MSFLLISAQDLHGFILSSIYKSDFYSVFVNFKIIVEKQFDKLIKILQCDGGGEFNKTEFLNFLAANGIIRHNS